MDTGWTHSHQNFGGKDEITVQCYLALVTLLTRRPTRIMLDRDESFLAGIKRHPFHMRYKTGCTTAGKLVAAEVELIADTGAYASLGPAVLALDGEREITLAGSDEATVELDLEGPWLVDVGRTLLRAVAEGAFSA